MGGTSVDARSTLGWGLINGLAYLHKHNIAHRDIKPDNLVCDSSYRLQIIDPDLAIKVEDENAEISKYRGTRGWTAPEMGKQDEPTPMYSPIRADRWSCGLVLLKHILVRSERANPLLRIAHELTAQDPWQRPSLLDCSSDVGNVPDPRIETSGPRQYRPRQDMEEVGDESMKQPDAKKPRLQRLSTSMSMGSAAILTKRACRVDPSFKRPCLTIASIFSGCVHYAQHSCLIRKDYPTFMSASW